MNVPLQLQTFLIDNTSVQIYIPHAEALKKEYAAYKEKDPSTPFPYWAQVWPSAIALATFLHNNSHYIQNKKVLELAGGLGLPSIIAAQKASRVIYSDYLQEPLNIVQKTVEHYSYKNIHVELLNWHHLPPGLSTDVLLLSDINYNPGDFDVLYKVIEDFINKGTTIIISTPQRLTAKTFINRLLKWGIDTEEINIHHNSQPVTITILVLKAAL